MSRLDKNRLTRVSLCNKTCLEYMNNDQVNIILLDIIWVGCRFYTLLTIYHYTYTIKKKKKKDIYIPQTVKINFSPAGFVLMCRLN